MDQRGRLRGMDGEESGDQGLLAVPGTEIPQHAGASFRMERLHSVLPRTKNYCPKETYTNAGEWRGFIVFYRERRIAVQKKPTPVPENVKKDPEIRVN